MPRPAFDHLWRHTRHQAPLLSDRISDQQIHLFTSHLKTGGNDGGDDGDDDDRSFYIPFTISFGDLSGFPWSKVEVENR